MWLSDFFAKRRGIGLPVFSECVLALHNASEPITLFSQRVWCGAQHFQRRLWEFVVFFGLNRSTSGLTTTFGYSPLGITFHPRGFYLPGFLNLFAFPSTSLDLSSARELWQPLRTFCVNTTVSTAAVSFKHLCYFASAFTLPVCSAPQPLGTRHYLSLLNLLFPHFCGVRGRAAPPYPCTY